MNILKHESIKHSLKPAILDLSKNEFQIFNSNRLFTIIEGKIESIDFSEGIKEHKINNIFSTQNNKFDNIKGENNIKFDL